MNKIIFAISGIINSELEIVFENEENFQIIGTAAEANELYELIERNEPDIIITDVCFNKRTGLAVTHKVKRINNDIKIIFLSEHIKPHTVFQCKKFGVSAIVDATIQKEEIKYHLKKAIESSKKFYYIDGDSSNYLLFLQNLKQKLSSL